MVITSIQQAKKDELKVNVFLDGNFWSSFTKDDLIKFKLHKGLSLSEEEADELQKKSQVSKIKLQALRKYSATLKSEKDIRTYLYKKNLEPEALESVIEYLKERSVINDKYFAEKFSELKLHANKYSINRIKAELKKKGISDNIIKNIEQLNSDADETDAIKKYLDKNSTLPKQKLIQRLMMRGFKYENIKKFLQ